MVVPVLVLLAFLSLDLTKELTGHAKVTKLYLKHMTWCLQLFRKVMHDDLLSAGADKLHCWRLEIGMKTVLVFEKATPLSLQAAQCKFMCRGRC